jgi:hypothetical protein
MGVEGQIMDDAMTEIESLQIARVILQQGKINSSILSTLLEIARLTQEQGNAGLLIRIQSLLVEVERQVKFIGESETLLRVEPLWDSEKNGE